MEFLISIQSQVAPRKVAAVASGLRRAINGLPGVSYTGQVISQGAAQGQERETLLVGLPPSKVPATEGLKASFEPRVLTQDQLRRLAGALSGP